MLAPIILGVAGTPFTRSTLDYELQSIRQDVLRIGSLVEEQIRQAVFALKERSVPLARQVIESDVRVNELRYKVEEECLKCIARQQPTARDLRQIISCLHIAVELERIGDHAAGIANISLRMGEGPLIKPLVDIPRMQELAVAMIHSALDAFLQSDTVLAQKVADDDDAIDALYNQVLRELLTYMGQDPKLVSGATYLLWVAHNLERIGDRATNLCERVIFTATGALGDYKQFRPRDE
jgi:phosphate transport system protein